ncbi:MAG: DUF6088 family protein [Opitutaceae bacterium]
MLKSSIPLRIIRKIAAKPANRVWTSTDFSGMGPRDAVDKALQRLTRTGKLRRIERGLYERPRTNPLTQKATSTDYREILDALTRRDRVRMLVDGMTAANDLGLTDAVPARVMVHTDARRRSIRLNNLVIEFRRAAPSRLYWAGRPAMRVVQALHWVKDMLPTDRDQIAAQLRKILAAPKSGPAIRTDLENGFGTLPAWMQDFIRPLISVK